METISCHSNQSSCPIETQIHIYLSPLPQPVDAIRVQVIWKELASQIQRSHLKMLTDGQTPNTCTYHKLTYNCFSFILSSFKCFVFFRSFYRGLSFGIKDQMSQIMRKPVLIVSNQVRHKPVSTDTEGLFYLCSEKRC